MTLRLLLSVSPGQVWAALAAESELEAFNLFRGCGQALVGDIYRGRVVALQPELGAFIDVGYDRPGFLRVEDMPRGTKLREGEAVIVEVAKEARADKAPGLTMKLDRPIEPIRSARSPALLDRRETPLESAVRLFATSNPDAIVIDDAGALASARAWLKRHHAGLVDKLFLHGEASALFEAFGVAAAIEALQQPRVALGGGGAITIETTAAATMIDVDGGRAKAVPVNLAAARAIARQIRLRNLSGPIVIDFITMKRRPDRERVKATLIEALGEDGDFQFPGWTRLGHFELVRKRRGASLAEILFEHEPGGTPTKSSLTVALDALRAAERQNRGEPGRRIALRVHAAVAASLARQANDALRTLEAKLGYPLDILVGPYQRDHFEMVPS